MCHITQLSCGMSCGKRLPCERHVCPKVCHPGACLNSMEICALPCDKIRNCGHPCGAACHEDDCPDSKCKIMVSKQLWIYNLLQNLCSTFLVTQWKLKTHHLNCNPKCFEITHHFLNLFTGRGSLPVRPSK